MRLFAALCLVASALFWSHPFYARYLAGPQPTWPKVAAEGRSPPVLVPAPAAVRVAAE